MAWSNSCYGWNTDNHSCCVGCGSGGGGVWRESAGATFNFVPGCDFDSPLRSNRPFFSLYVTEDCVTYLTESTFMSCKHFTIRWRVHCRPSPPSIADCGWWMVNGDDAPNFSSHTLHIYTYINVCKSTNILTLNGALTANLVRTL